MSYRYSYEELLERYREDVSDEEVAEELVKEVLADPDYAAEVLLLLTGLATPLRDSYKQTGNAWMEQLAGKAAWLSSRREKIESEIAERKLEQDRLDKMEAEAWIDT